MNAVNVWDAFMDRVIAAQRDLAKHGGSPYRYTVYVAPAHYAALEPYLGRTILPVEPDPRVTGTDILLRHEVRA